jgi:glycosyltransferase involved in cell wall biosynthesis
MTEEIKPTMLIFAPIATRSGYGDMGRDIVRHFIEYDKFDVKIISAPWGDTPMNALDENNPKDKMLIDRILTQQMNKQPEVFVHIGIPSEAQPIGKYNILCTAGIETTAVSAQWIEACNRMDLILTISEHSKNSFLNSKYGIRDAQNNIRGNLEVTKPVEVLHNCIDTQIFGKKAPVDAAFTKVLDSIEETFCFAFVGHWLRGDFGEDRKNVAFLIKMFLETFKQVTDKPRPALILKTSSAGFSILDKEEILSKIKQIKDSVTLEYNQKLPNIYLLHGELTEKEMNTLYNHPKVKAHISFTKGEGFGRPLLEASVSGKPVVASGWSGHLDFLNKDGAVLVGGELKNVHPTAAWENVLLQESSWFSPDPQQCVNAMAVVFYEYTRFKNSAYTLADVNRKKFSYDTIQKKTWELLDKYVPEFPKQIPLKLPTLKKIELPKLKKTE